MKNKIMCAREDCKYIRNHNCTLKTVYINNYTSCSSYRSILSMIDLASNIYSNPCIKPKDGIFVPPMMVWRK